MHTFRFIEEKNGNKVYVDGEKLEKEMKSVLSNWQQRNCLRFQRGKSEGCLLCVVCASRTGREKAFWALTQGKYYARVVKEEDGVGEGGVLRETGVLKHLTVENEFEHVGVGLVPVVRPIESPGAQAMVCDVRAKIAVDEVVRAMGQQINIEMRWEVSDVDPTAITLSWIYTLGQQKDSMENEEEEEDFHCHGKNIIRRKRLSVWIHNYMCTMINSDKPKMSIKDGVGEMEK